MQRTQHPTDVRSKTLTTAAMLRPAADDAQLCGYASHLCGREKLAGYEFCLRHILEDRSAPFKQCNFTYCRATPPKRCSRPAPKSDRKDGYCWEHSKRALMARQKSTTTRKRSSSAFRALDDLSHYKIAKSPQIATTVEGVEIKKEDVDEKPDPLELVTKRVSSANQRLFDSSEMDSDEEPQTIESAWNGAGHDDHSDAESLDSELDNPLKHAGRYSAEEVVRIMRDKLIRLQKLYIDKFQRLRYLLREEGRKYKHFSDEKQAELSTQKPKVTLEDLIGYDKMKSLNHYHRPQGFEAELHHAFLERRYKLGGHLPSSSSSNSGTTTQTHFKPTTLQKCSYHITSSTKCLDPVIPASKFCSKHILEDTSQVLFRTCGYVVNSSDDLEASKDGPCETPIVDVLDGATCIYHTQFQTPFTVQEEDKQNEVSKSDGQKYNTESDVDVTTTTDLDSKPTTEDENVGIRAKPAPIVN